MRAVYVLVCLGLTLLPSFQVSAQTAGSCQCVSGSRVNVRKSACGSVLGSTSSGQCFRATGCSKSCYLGGTRYNFYELDYGTSLGWIANTLLTSGYSYKCSSAGLMTHSAAMYRLNSAGITVTSSGSCSDRCVGTCTSLDGIRSNSIDQIIKFKDESGCDVRITGGTETGHSSGAKSHGRGYKLDIGLDWRCVDPYIRDNYSDIGIRSDGSQMYKDSRGNIYAKEGHHWDILFP